MRARVPVIQDFGTAAGAQLIHIFWGVVIFNGRTSSQKVLPLKILRATVHTHRQSDTQHGQCWPSSSGA